MAEQLQAAGIVSADQEALSAQIASGMVRADLSNRMRILYRPCLQGPRHA